MTTIILHQQKGDWIKDETKHISNKNWIITSLRRRGAAGAAKASTPYTMTRRKDHHESHIKTIALAGRVNEQSERQ